MTPFSQDLTHYVDWEQRFRCTKVFSAQLAITNPNRGLICTQQSGVFQLHSWEIPTLYLKPLTNKPTGVTRGTLAIDGRYVYYLDDEQGNEVGHYVRIPFEGGIKEDITPDLPPYASLDIVQSQNGNLFGFIAVSEAGFHLYSLECTPSGVLKSPRLLWQSTAFSLGLILSHKGELAVLSTTDKIGNNIHRLLAIETSTGEIVAELQDIDASLQFVSFSPLSGDMRLLAMTDKYGFNRPFIWSPYTNERQDIVLPNLVGDVRAWRWFPDGRHLLLYQINDACYQLYRYDLLSETLTRLNHPNGTLNSPCFHKDQIWIVLSDATYPERLVALDPKNGELAQTLLVASDVPKSSSWQSIHFPSSDGTQIQAWLALPLASKKPFPTIIHVHGGPAEVVVEGFSPSCQAWLDHGFAWLSVNYRGSTSFGKTFERAIWGNLGQLEVEDMAAARRWLVDQGIAVSNAIFVTGASYGGYLTLQALGKYPDLWAGGMAEVAIADWFLMYEDQVEMLRSYQQVLFGGTPSQKPEIHRLASPITYAEQVRAPILIIQGRNDARCPARQMQAYEQRMRSTGKNIQVHWFDAGHFQSDIEQVICHQALKLAFVQQILQRISE
ncbi:MAG: prolyl oligopeptidase family serine peptidase [Crinalium sp.]